jgi:hypothetical protein
MCCNPVAVSHQPEDGFLKSFFEKTKNMNSKERGRYLEEDEDLSDAHEASAREGDTAVSVTKQLLFLK